MSTTEFYFFVLVAFGVISTLLGGVLTAFPSEVAYKKAHGVDALLAQWRRRGVVFSNPMREP